MNLRDQLLQIVGAENFSDDSKVLEAYSRDFSFVPPGMPNFLVKPKDASDVQKVVRFANEQSVPIVPVSSSIHFEGATIPKQGGIVLDLSRMNRILEIDESNRRVRIEAGVTWGQLTAELEKKGLRMVMPLLPHAQRSVLTDYLEREVPTNTVYDYGEPLQSMEVVWPTGEIFRMGSASVNGYPDSQAKGANPSGPGLDFYRFLQGAQGTMGIVTWSNLKIESIPKIDKVLFAPVNDLTSAMEFLHRILPRRIGQECLLLNNVSLAAILSEGEQDGLAKLRRKLPSWTLILVLSGLWRRPEEKIAYEEKALSEILRNEFKGLSLAENLPGLPGLERKILPMLRKPWPRDVPYWKHRYKGGCQSLFFISRPLMVKKFIDIVQGIASRRDTPITDLGSYLQPIEHNRACHLEFHFFYDPGNLTDIEKVRSLYRETAIALMNEGAFFTRPYGELASMVYERTTGYTLVLRRVKNVFDPKNIMNPGSLCF